ncbi:hypothetical protein MASR2M48_34660 [Spirochaetota bacterium]
MATADKDSKAKTKKKIAPAKKKKGAPSAQLKKIQPSCITLSLPFWTSMPNRLANLVVQHHP